MTPRPSNCCGARRLGATAGIIQEWMWPVLLGLALVPGAWTETQAETSSCGQGSAADGALVATYTISGATPEQESVLRQQIQIIQPALSPCRILFVPHWRYVYAARIYRLHVPTGMTSKMFTHLSSRSVYIDADRCLGKGWLGFWIAHELGHLVTNSAREEDAERVAHLYRQRLKRAAF